MNKEIRNISFHLQDEDNCIKNLITMELEVYCNGEVKHIKEKIPLSVMDKIAFNEEEFLPFVWKIVDSKYETKQP
jgi:hypothetical protein